MEQKAPISDIAEMLLTELESRRERLRYLLRLVKLEAARQATARGDATLRKRKCRKLLLASGE